MAADRNLPARWRALKQLAIQSYDTDRELLFFSEEVRAARFVCDWPIFHGRSGRPLHGVVSFGFGLAFSTKYSLISDDRY